MCFFIWLLEAWKRMALSKIEIIDEAFVTGMADGKGGNHRYREVDILC